MLIYTCVSNYFWNTLDVQIKGLLVSQKQLKSNTNKKEVKVIGLPRCLRGRALSCECGLINGLVLYVLRVCLLLSLYISRADSQLALCH